MFRWLLLGACLLSQAVTAQDRFFDAKETLQKYFWGELYASGGNTFFCDKAFDKKSILITEGYIYATPWIRDHLECGTPWRCRKESKRYQQITSDLHNIFPVEARFDLDRGTSKFEDLDSSVPVEACGEKRGFGVIEPPDRIKGDIARALLYMHTTYQLPLYGDLNQLKRWNREDPPSDSEKERNLRISNIQGNENPFITYPSQAEIVTLP